MPSQYTLFHRFEDRLRSLPANRELGQVELLDGRFLVASDGPVEVHYAPLDYINRGAAVVIIGVTPGWHQMQLAYRHARLAMNSSEDPGHICRAAKKNAAFAGAMRSNLGSPVETPRR